MREYLVTNRDPDGEIVDVRAVQAVSEDHAVELVLGKSGGFRSVTAEPSAEGIPEAVIAQNPGTGGKGEILARVRPGRRLWEAGRAYTGGQIIWVTEDRLRSLGKDTVEPVPGYGQRPGRP